MINQFIASFVVDYDAIGNKEAKAKSSVKVWVGAGRDQASILKNLIDNYFTPQTGISVDLQLVKVRSSKRRLPAKVLQHRIDAAQWGTG